MKKEYYIDIVGYEGYYQISSLGRVLSLPRFYSPEYNYIGGKPDKNGRIIVALCVEQKSRSFGIHTLVATHFLHKGNNDTVIHLDGDSTNNDVLNLRWVKKELIAMQNIPKNCRGVNNGNCKITKEKAIAIKNEYGKLSHSKTAKKHDVSLHIVKGIFCGKNWTFL